MLCNFPNLCSLTLCRGYYKTTTHYFHNAQTDNPWHGIMTQSEFVYQAVYILYKQNTFENI